MIGEAFVRLRSDDSLYRPEVKRQVERAGRDVERSLSRSNRELARFSRGTLVGTGALGQLGRAAAFASLSFIGGAGLVVGIRSTISAAAESEVAAGQLTNALERQGLATEANRRAIEERTQALAEMAGFDDELLTQTFVRLVGVTGNVNKALRDNAIAADIARQRGISLEAATQLVVKAELGQVGALRRVGIAARAGASATELLDLLQRKFAGSAEAYGETAAGAQARFQVALENTQEIIGTALLPSLTRLLNKASEWLNNQENQRRIQLLVNDAIDKGEKSASFLARTVGQLTDAYRSYREQLGPLGKTLPEQIQHFRELGRQFDDGSHGLREFEQQWKSFVASIEQGSRRIDSAMAGIEGLRVNPPEPGPLVPSRVSGTGIAGRPLTDAERLAIMLGLDPNNVQAIRAQRALDQRAFDFAQKMIRERRGRTAFFAAEAERLAREIAQADARLQAIADQAQAERERRAEEAERRREEARQREQERLREAEEDVAFRLEGIQLGVQVDPLTIAQVNRAMEERRQARIESLLGVPDRLSLATQIQEQRTTEEETLVPFLQRELKAAQRRLKLLKDLGATKLQQMQQQLTIATLRRRIRDILNQDRPDSRVNVFEEAAREFELYGSNIAPAGAPLSPQDARGSLAAGILSRQGPTIHQHFYGDRNPGQAITQASQAARALR